MAIGLGRRACGFEINKNAFDFQVGETEKIVSGELTSTLRKVPENLLVNKGKPLTQNEDERIHSDFAALTGNGLTRKAAFESLSQKYGRGYWSLLNLVGGRETTYSGKSAEPMLFPV